MPEVALRLEALTKRYGPLVAVRDLSLEVYAGEILGFLGPNGAGKTTSIHLMCGLLKPDAGRVWIHGRPVDGSRSSLRAVIGLCPQQTMVWGKLTCLEQMEFIGEMYGLTRRQARRRAEELLEVMGMSGAARRLASTLSGGMQRRLNILLALLHEPLVLVLDEPEAGLDPQSRVMVRDYIREWARRPTRTVILTTHNMDEADRMAQRVAILDHGQLLVLDTPEALKRRVGEGDVLEIELGPGAALPAGPGLPGLAPLGLQATLAGRSILVRAPRLVEQLPAVVAALREAGYPVGEIRLRQNTLEDVFLSLTGRRLRE